MRIQFSISRLMIILLVAALVLTAWRDAGAIPANLTFNVTVLVLIVATYKARFAQGRDAAWWLGFASVGRVHLGFWFRSAPSGLFYGFRIDFITGLVYWDLESYLGSGPIRLDRICELEASAARMLILRCATAMIAALIGAWSFSLAAWVGERQRKSATPPIESRLRPSDNPRRHPSSPGAPS